MLLFFSTTKTTSDGGLLPRGPLAAGLAVALRGSQKAPAKLVARSTVLLVPFWKTRV